MLSELASHNDDIKCLLNKGYALAVDSNYLVVRDVPYLGQRGELQTGAIVTKLVFVDKVRVCQEDHQIFFAGSPPHNLDGTPIQNLGGGATPLALSDACKDVVVQRSFSNKPKETGNFQDFFEKIETYVAQISGPAMQRHGATPYTFRAVEEGGQKESSLIFKVRDTLTSRAEISDLAAKFADDDVAVIGLGGTGSYLLDFLVKTPVTRIRGFDPDLFYVHNAFRSPGAIRSEEFGTPKAEVYAGRHENFRNGLTIARKFVDESSSDDFAGRHLRICLCRQGAFPHGNLQTTALNGNSVHRCWDGVEQTKRPSHGHVTGYLLFEGERRGGSPDEAG